MSFKYKKIYVDTRFKSADSKSTSDFSFELPETMYFENNTVFYIDDMCIPHSWWTVETGINDKVYLYTWDPNTPESSLSYILALSPGNYTGVELALELQTKLRAATDVPSHPNTFTCVYNTKTNSITVQINYAFLSFKILTPDDLKTRLDGAFSLSYDVKKPDDCNDLLSNLDGKSSVYDSSHAFTTGFINMQPIHNIFLHSSNLGNYSNLGPLGEQTVIKKIPVTADQNQMIFDQVVLWNDYNDCSHQTLRTLKFQFKDSRGNLIPFHGCNTSFSIIFSKNDPNS